jgi:hypothetical protein
MSTYAVQTKDDRGKITLRPLFTSTTRKPPPPRGHRKWLVIE